ncbi:Hypothetical protein PHPALM_14999, partial [Phytophthora palmivora]
MIAETSTTWLSMIDRTWNSLRVEQHGHYSPERLIALQKFSETTSIMKLSVVILVTPLPCLLVVTLADVAPLNSPEAGTNSNGIFWLRSCLIIGLYTLSFVVQFREMLPTLPMSRERSLGITVFVSSGVILFAYSMSLIIGFPVPFLMVLGAPVWMVLILGSFAISWRDNICGDSALQTQIVNGLHMFMVQMSMIAVYPFYIYIFTSLSSVEQACFSLVLLIIKLAIKNGISHYIRSNTDMQPEIVVFNVDVFNALFVSFSMQNSTSKLTVIVIITVDFVRMASSIREVTQLVRELKKIERQISYLKPLIHGGLGSAQKTRNPLSYACSIVARRSFASKNYDMRRLSTKKGPRLQVRPLHFLFRSEQIFPLEGHGQFAKYHSRTSKIQETRMPGTSRVDTKRFKSLSSADPQSKLVFMERQYARKVLNLLHLTEFTILIEYIEVIVPVVYSIYVVAMSYLPNRVYYEQLAYMDVDKLQSTLANVLLYSFLELLSLVVLTAFLRKTMEYSPVHQLAFVLWTQWKMVQSKLILWVVYVVQSSLIHFESMVVLHHNELDRTLWGPATTTGRSRGTDMVIYIQLIVAGLLGVLCALDYEKPEAFVRLMLFMSALVLYGDVIVPIIRVARDGEVLPLPATKLVLHCIWVWNTSEEASDAENIQNAVEGCVKSKNFVKRLMPMALTLKQCLVSICIHSNFVTGLKPSHKQSLSIPHSNAHLVKTMRGGLSLYPLYVDPADAAAADTRETLYPVASEPAAGTQSFDPQRLAMLIRSSTGRLSSTSETTDIDADVLNSLPKWAQAVPFLRDKLKRSSGQQSEIDYERPRKRRSFGTRDDSMEDEASELQNCLDELNDDPDEDSAMEDVEIKELPTLAEITADSVEKYVEMLEKLIDLATERRQQENFEQEDMDVFHSKEVKVLRQILNAIEKNDWMNKLKPDLLIALMNEFDAQVRVGLTVDVFRTESPTKEKSRLQFDERLVLSLLASLDVAICELIIMTTPQIDRRVLSEETIDNCFQLLHHVMRLEVMLKLPTAKRTLRTVKLQNSSDSVQRITTAVVSIIQSCSAAWKMEPDIDSLKDSVEPSTPDTVAEEVPPQNNDMVVSTLEDTRNNAKLFVRMLLKACWKKIEGRDNRVVLDNFVEDLLVMFVRPEWIGAEDLLVVLSSSLASILHANISADLKNPVSHQSFAALSLIGQICTTIKMYQRQVDQSAFGDDIDDITVVEEHMGCLREAFIGKKARSRGAQPRIDLLRQIALKHIVVMYLQRHTNHQSDSMKLLILKFISESEALWDGAESGFVEQEKKLWKSLWEVPLGGSISMFKMATPSSELAFKASLHLAVKREFCGLFDKLLAHIMALLSKGMPSLRARVMKCLRGIVDVDPMLMAETGVQLAVERCCSDEKPSVREAAVDLIGTYVLLQPLLFDKYFGVLAGRIRDKGIKVRKSVCKIFKMALISMHEGSNDTITEQELRRESACMKCLVERIGDAAEDQGIKNFIIDTFQEIWFGADLSSSRLSNPLSEFGDGNTLPPGWSAVVRENPDSISPGAQFVSEDGNVANSVEEAWSSYRTPMVAPSSLVQNNNSKLDNSLEVVTTIIEVIHGVPNLGWFSELLKRLLTERNSTSLKRRTAAQSIKNRADQVAIAE